MKALCLDEMGYAVRERHPPTLAPGEAVIRPLLAGVCATDLELVNGYMGFRGVLGHEFVGMVEDAADATWVGARVVGEINAACGTCETCSAGRRSHCPHRSVLGILNRDGVFAECFVLPLKNLERVPESVPDEAAVFVEPLAAALEILEQVHIAPTSRCIVLGAGRLGQLCTRVLALTGATIDVVSRSASRQEFLPKGVGSVLLEDARTLRGADLVVDATGDAAGLSLATELVRPRGTIVLKTTIHGPAAVPTTPWVIDELRLIGSRCGPFAPALRLLERGLVDPRPLITTRVRLAEAAHALELAADSRQMKVLISP